MGRLSCDRMFVAVMETGSFAAAAARLGTSSGQASKLVSRLEAELGVRLLNRTTRALSPTEAGRAYFDRIRVLLDEFDALDLTVKDAARTPRGRLKLTAPLTFGTVQLAPALNEFALRYPDISLDVQFSDRIVNLVDEGYDAAIRVGLADDSSLIARRLCTTRIIIVASNSYLARRGTPARPEDLGQHDCIIDTNFREPGSWRFHGPDGPLTVGIAGRLRFSNAGACLGAAEAGLGIANVPGFVAARSLRSGQVVPLLQSWEVAPYGIYALYPPGKHLAAKVRVFVDFLAERFRGDVDWADIV